MIPTNCSTSNLSLKLQHSHCLYFHWQSKVIFVEYPTQQIFATWLRQRNAKDISSQTQTKEKRLRNVLKNWCLFAFVWIYSNVWEIFLVRKLTGGKIMPNCFAKHEIGINIQGHKRRDNWSRFLPISCWHIWDNICFVNGNKLNR